MTKTFCLTLALGSMLAAGPARAQSTESSFIRANSIQEVVSHWRPEVHLYVLGDVGLKQDALQELGEWIGDRHWTVLLVRDAYGQTYTDRDGILRSGVDAIEYGTGQGITGRPGFAEQLHPRSAEPDGAVFTIVVAQRALFYSGSRAQDNRGLGEEQFRDNLDTWAIEAMRSGGDVAGAVRNTITNIDDRLASVIAQEIESAKRAREQEFERAKQSFVEANAAVASLEKKTAALRQAYPDLKGNLVQPHALGLRRQLAEAEARFAGGPVEAALEADQIRMRTWTKIGEIDRYHRIARDLDAVEADLARQERREYADAARKELLDARQALLAARERHRRAAPGYEQEGAGAAAYKASIASRKISSAKANADFLRLLTRFLFFALLAGLLTAGATLHLRRRGVKREALELLDAWHTALDTKLSAILDELERRVGLFVGAASGEGRRPWAGETLRLAEAIRADVGSLYILWTSASGVLQLAEALIRARGLGAVYNFFFPGRYRRGIALLKDEPVPFDPADGLPMLFGYERTWRDDLLGDLASYEPFRKTFQEIVDELNLRAARAAEALEIVEVSAMDGPAELDGIGERIRRTAALENGLQMASFVDGLFLLPSLFARTLPAAEAVLARARELFPTDPVTALAGDGATARRIAAEAAQIVAVIAGARRGVLPAAEAGLATLGQAFVGTGWILEERSRLSGRADLLAVQATETPAAAGIAELARNVGLLGERVERAVGLSRVLGETARPEIQRVTGLVQSARSEWGRALALPPDSVLREDGADPSERLASAAGQASTTHDSLGKGELETATTALSEAARLTAEAEAIVEATRRAFSEQAATVEERCTETFRIEALLPEHDQILAGIRGTFAASVLALRADDPARPEANATLTDNLEEARTHVGLAHTKLDRAVAAFASGGLLASADLLRQVKEHQEFAVHRLEEVAARRDRLNKAVESNRTLLETLEDRVREDQVSIAGDPRIMRPTLDAFAEGRGRLERGRQAVAAVPGDPLAAEDELLAARALLDDVHDRRAPADRALHAEARNSLDAADRQLAAAAALAEKAAVDGIADSPATTNALAEIAALSAAQEQARAALDVSHGDWQALDAEADRIAAEAAHAAARLSGELAAAEAATAAISSASDWVREATTWDGDYGVRISGNPGASVLSEARSLIAQGRYGDAESSARQASREASDALAEAKEAVRRRAEQERREREERERREREDEERRERASLSSSRSSSWSGGGGSSSGSSSGSGRSSWSGSSGSGSSSRSSGSGKSGW